jgi:hypothetical protein
MCRNTFMNWRCFFEIRRYRGNYGDDMLNVFFAGCG